ncbi:MAG: RNA methyltransferase [Prevotella sp.]|nr:RNA methyltransferase [Prevotella sp.]
MLSKATIKRIRALEQKKFRRQTGLFVAEGPKVVGDLLATMATCEIFATAEWLKKNQRLVEEKSAMSGEKSVATITEISDEELRRLSFLQHPQQVLATFKMSASPPTPLQIERGDLIANSQLSTLNCQLSIVNCQLSLALDGIQDPGNLGTIIRIADWFGIETIFCSPDTADAYAPKVVQATMGSLARVKIVYQDLAMLIDALPNDFPVYGTLLDGNDIYAEPLTPHGLIVMGNEGNGISPEIAQKINRRLLIPNFPADRPTADSLNVAIATAITCAEFRRRHLQGAQK